MNRDELLRQYDERLALFDRLRTEAVFALEDGLAELGVKLHSVTSRLKSRDSFLAKAERKSVGKPFEEIRDLVGLRVVCLFLPDIPRIGDLVRRIFHVVAEDNKVAGVEVSSFGYMSVHFDAMLRDTNSGPRYDAVRGMQFEIQVRTIAMDAWANVAHHLSYKSDVDVPDALRRDFYALSGLFYVADKHFEMFYGASKESSRQAYENLKNIGSLESKTEPLNVDTLSAFLQVKFPDRRQLGVREVSDLLSELDAGEVRTVGEVEMVVNDMAEAFEKYEKKYPPNTGQYAAIGVVRVSFHIFDRRFYRIMYYKADANASDKDFDVADKKFDEFRSLVHHSGKPSLAIDQPNSRRCVVLQVRADLELARESFLR